MAHILIAYKQFPAPSVGHAGGESLFKLMASLHRRGHTLTLVSRIREEERHHLPSVEAVCERVVTVSHHRSRGEPRLIAVPLSYLAFRRAVRQTIRDVRPDFLHVETTQTAAILVGLDRPLDSYRTQDVNWYLQEQHLMRSRGISRLKAMIRYSFFRRFEPWLCRCYDLTLAISEGDRALLAPFVDPTRLLMVPLTPDLSPAEDTAPAVEDGPMVLFVGAMSRDHNIAGVTWFLNSVWPLIREEEPQARFVVVGSHPPESLQARTDPGVMVTGFVEELTPWYEAATVFVSPLLVAGGLLQKIMDAMAMGVPVVATPVCNHGLCAVPGEHLIIADQPRSFADAILSLLDDPEARKQVGLAGQAFVETRYDLESAIDHWEASILALMNKD
jgi:glycosyltransferase involved in cell wall biosynthesis